MGMYTTSMRVDTKRAPRFPSLQYEGRTVDLGELIGQLEYIDNVAYSEMRRTRRDGVRDCQREGVKHLETMIDLAADILDRLNELSELIGGNDD